MRRASDYLSIYRFLCVFCRRLLIAVSHDLLILLLVFGYNKTVKRASKLYEERILASLTQLNMPSHPKAAQGKQPSAEEHHQRTLARISQIQSHLSNSPRGQRLKGKTCVITGVGSLHGIG